PPPCSTPCPYTTLFRSVDAAVIVKHVVAAAVRGRFDVRAPGPRRQRRAAQVGGATEGVDLAVAAEHPVPGRGGACRRRSGTGARSEEHTSELQSQSNLV